jgi:hypothetical protein
VKLRKRVAHGAIQVDSDLVALVIHFIAVDYKRTNKMTSLVLIFTLEPHFSNWCCGAVGLEEVSACSNVDPDGSAKFVS